ncbi:hypothetical protein EBR21_10870 [bacterium]|nr:hypothetical protein [bacterium]
MNPMRSALLALLLTACGSFTSVKTPQSVSTSRATEADKKIVAGDVLLVPLNCYVCNAIESETGTPFSHSVVVANTTDDPTKRLVFEAWGEVKTTPYLEVAGRKQKNQKLFHLRPVEFENQKAPDSRKINSIFEQKFRGLPFDDEYLWNNADELGREKLYCSEFVIKFMNRLMKNQLNPSPMNFSKNLSFWKKYYDQFHILPPTGLPGGSPATLYFSDLFLKLGDVDDN